MIRLLDWTCGALAFTSAAIGTPLAAAIITVTPATLASGLAATRSGDTLRLIGTFGSFSVSNRFFNSTVVMDASRATFTGPITINNVKNLSINGGTFNIVGQPRYTKAVVVYGSHNILFDGPLVMGSAGGAGIVFDGTNGATLKNGTFSGLQLASVFDSVYNGSVTNNTITGAVSDGIDIANSHRITATYNSCSGGNPGPGVHPDCIQLWSVSSKSLQSDIIVSNNAAKGPTQGFTSFSATGGALRIQIINNSVDGSYPQGIACYDCIDSSISYNDLSTLAGSTYLTNVNVIGGSRDLVIGNYIKPYSSSHRSLLSSFDGVSDDESLDQAHDLAALVGTPPALLAGATIPEAPSWAMLVAGFSVVGVTVRLRRRRYDHLPR